MTRVEVRVPATTANLGPGFDALGLALGLYNRMVFERTDGPVEVIARGEGAGRLETGPENLIYRSVTGLCVVAGVPAPPLRITLDNAIPVSRGLGSSSSAIVGGLVGANALLGEPLDREALLRLAADIEGHPDNVTPALLGGLQVCSTTEEGPVHLSVPVPPGLRAVVCIPGCAVSTEAARQVLPATYSHADAVFNVGRTALLVAALATGRLAALGTAMQDRLHQPYRAPLIPGFEAALQAAGEAGALGACLSGSGSTLLALTKGDEEAIGSAMTRAVEAAGTPARWLALQVDREGAKVLR